MPTLRLFHLSAPGVQPRGLHAGCSQPSSTLSSQPLGTAIREAGDAAAVVASEASQLVCEFLVLMTL